VDTLTHLNVAFYYIDPGSFAITRMPGMSNEPYDKLVNLKQKAPGLQIWLSIGGWTFSDNFTATQPVWNAISNSESNRAKFINQLVDFMGDQGFDGVDLDWE
jgi:chitinase